MKYVAYGSNMNMEQMAVRCPDAVPIGTAVLRGWRLVFNCFATIEEAEGCETPAAVWEITGPDEKKLDDYEGYPFLYYKRTLPVTVTPIGGGDGYAAEAMVYIMEEGHDRAMPYLDYYAGILEGYDDFGIDHSALEKALARSIGGSAAEQYLKALEDMLRA